MLRLSIFLFTSAAAIAMYFVATVQYLELVFDHYYRYPALGLSVLGLSLGFALSATQSKKESLSLIPSSLVACVFIAVAGQVLAWYVAFHLVYGATWAFLLLVGSLLIPYVFGGCALSKVRLENGAANAGKWTLVVGAVTGLCSALLLVDYTNSLSTVWLFSSSLLAISMLPLMGKRDYLQVFLGLWVAAGLIWLAITFFQTDVYPQWDVSKGTVSKPIAAALASQKELQIDSSEWRSGYRLDQVSNKRSRKDGFGWNVSNGSAPLPVAYDADALPFEWWLRRFPLAALPFEIAEPGQMLSVGVARGPDAHMAALKGFQSYKCPGDAPGDCDGEVRFQYFTGLGGGVLTDNVYDLIHLSVPHPLKSAWVGASGPDEALVSEEMLRRYIGALNSEGILAVTAREEALFVKLLLSVWSNLLPDQTSNVMGLKDRMRVFRLNSYAPYKGSYRYLMLVARKAFSEKQLVRVQEASSRLPVEAIIYQNQVHKAPYRFFDRSFASHSLENVQKHFTRYVGFTLQHPVDLESASLAKPGFFHLSVSMHPFLRGLMTGILGVMIYGLLFSFRGRRNIEHRDQSTKPAVSVLLVQVLASAAGAAFSLCSLIPPAISTMQIPLNGFLLAVSFMLFGAVLAWRGAESGSFGRHIVKKYSVLILGFLLAMYALREKVLGFLVADQNLLVLGVSLLLMLALGWLSCRIHRRLAARAQQAYLLTLPWVFTLSGLGLLAGIVVSTQAWLQAGWSWVICAAFISYVAVILIEAWIARSAMVPEQPAVTGQAT